MIQSRTLRVGYDKPTSVVCVVGTELNVDLNRSAPPNSKFFSVKCTSNVHYIIMPWRQRTSNPCPHLLIEGLILVISMSSASEEGKPLSLDVVLQSGVVVTKTTLIRVGATFAFAVTSEQRDRWIQDEMEFGYIDSPHQQFPVVLDSPRNRGLVDFPLHELLGPDFGYVTRVPGRKDVSSLDSFGNLDVSPPVTVNGKNYPLGRIVLGVAFPTATGGRSMTKVVQDFLRAQKVQEPIALFTDWLLVGHVDEFMTFVPAPGRKGFRLLLASPDAAYKLFKGLQKDGHGQAKLFEGVEGQEPVTVDEVLSNDSLLTQNKYAQSCIDWNRDVLKRELGLVDWDIIDVPILFRPWEKAGQQPRAVAYYPDMVNMIVLGKNLGIPKPFGPKVNGRCALEAEMCSLLEGLGLSCTFIDDFTSYHQGQGEVHCGSNVRRQWFAFKWWNLEM
ncbi:protein-arginine deiminase type-2 [Larimichthys crocea]|uniref:protein-arginine deiminase type-2 n=1 Tax=Larimichthys crocea TaxID=215358 RepID=UPI000F5D9D16|nr:protein-arginine deiminase type-2 [Larimichthys crocea]